MKKINLYLTFTILWSIFAIWICFREQQYWYSLLLIGIGAIPLLWELLYNNRKIITDYKESKSFQSAKGKNNQLLLEKEPDGQSTDASVEKESDGQSTDASGEKVPAEAGKPSYTSAITWLIVGIICIIISNSGSDFHFIIIGTDSIVPGGISFGWLAIIMAIYKFIVPPTKTVKKDN